MRDSHYFQRNPTVFALVTILYNRGLDRQGQIAVNGFSLRAV